MKQLGLWLIEQEVNAGYGTYDSAVVVAESREEALRIHPSGYKDESDVMILKLTWAEPENIKVTYLGMASKQAVARDRIVICSSYNTE